MKKTLIFTALLMAPLSALRAAEPKSSPLVPSPSTPMVPFVLPWDDGSPGASDLRAVLQREGPQIEQVSVQDGHLFSGGRRLRLFGVNMTAAACYPDHATAERVAARLAKFGVNAVRFHFLDATWGEPKLVDYASGDWRNWHSDSLDRLDYFAAQLRSQGIYLNLNLLVGRRFGASDGVDPAINQLDWKVAHAVGFFHSPHVAAQQEYARRLLTHRNPYTKQAYAADPGVAVVEINNENGLMHTWMSGDFDSLPEPFAGDLQRQWNAWLATRYGKTAALATAWKTRDEPLGAEKLTNGGFANGLQSWQLEEHGGAAATATVEANTVALTVRRAGTDSWHVQFHQAGLSLASDGLYTVRFRAAADRPREATVQLAQAHEPWHTLGWQATLSLDRDWREFSFTFTVAENEDNARLGFTGLNVEGAQFRFAGLSFKPGGRIGLEASESLENQSIQVPRARGTRPIPPKARRDWIAFLWDTEDSYWREMRRFLREDLGVKAPITGTITATSSPNLMAAMDMVDTHAYWQHPRFPGRPWDMNNWVVQNVPMTDHPTKATLPNLALARVAGRPHMVSEYGHPAPNLYAAEGPLLVAAYAALQDWDAIFLYTFSHSEQNTKAGKIPGFFDIGQHPTVMAILPAAALLFRRSDVAAGKDLVTTFLSADHERELIAQHGRAWSVVPIESLGLTRSAAFRHRVALDVSGSAPAPAVTEDQPPWVADTGELTWRFSDDGRGAVEIRSPRTKGATGRLDGENLDLGDGVRFLPGATAAKWCAITLSILEGKSFAAGARRALLVAAGQAENTNFTWKNPEKSSVAPDWGRGPSLVESVPASIVVPSFGGHPVVYALDERGQRHATPLPVTVSKAEATFSIGPPHGTLWYEIEWPN